MRKVYLDNNATTMVDPAVTEVMIPYLSQKFGNPSSLHEFGSQVHRGLARGMEALYAGLKASDEDDIVVNSCATEGNNTVLKSVLFDFIKGSTKKKQIITTHVEHPSVKNTCRYLETLGMEVIYLQPNPSGVVDVDLLRRHVDPERTALVSIMWANNETGLIFPIKELATFCHEQGVLFHTDGVQAMGKIPIDLQAIPVDYLTFSAHKFHGPKGVGGLYIRRGRSLTPLLHGGEQMGGLRSGTVNSAGLIAMGEAFAIATSDMSTTMAQISALRNQLEDAILAIDDTFIVGDRSLRTPNTILASFKGVEGEAMIWDLNKHGIAASTGSACASESLESNPTFVALKIDPELAHTGIRFSLSRFTTQEDIDYVIEVLGLTVKRLRNISSSY